MKRQHNANAAFHWREHPAVVAPLLRKRAIPGGGGWLTPGGELPPVSDKAALAALLKPKDFHIYNAARKAGSK